MYSSFQFNKVKIHRFNLEETLLQIKKYINTNQKIHVAVLNSYSLFLLNKDNKYSIACNSSNLTVADGMSLVWLSYLCGKPIRGRVAGPDLFIKAAELANNEGYSFFLMGSSKKTLLKLKNFLLQKFPALKISGSLAPPYKKEFTDTDNEAMVKQINKNEPDFLWVGLGAPKQEKWIYDNLNKLNVKAVIGVGAAFDFLAGESKRAPKWMQKIGLEWLFRLIQEPTRLWKRYLIGNTFFIWLVFKEKLRKLQGGR